MNKYNELCDIYNRCLPELAVSVQDFTDKLILPNSKIISNNFGFIIYDNNGIGMICIKPEYQRCGHGNDLLKQAEKDILKSSIKKIELKMSDEYLLPGVPMKSSNFFIKHGYKHSWGDTPCLDLIMDLSDAEISLENKNNVVYRVANSDDLEDLKQEVAKVDNDWVQYYSEIHDRIIVAEKDKKIAGFVILEDKNVFTPAFSGKKVSGFGAIGVVPEYRKLHIGFNLVKFCNLELKRRGFDISYAAYTYLEGFYKSLGFKPYVYYFMGVKEF